MKRRCTRFLQALSALALGALSSVPLAAEDAATAAQRKFIRGNLADKTAAVREASGSERQLAETGLDFAIAYQPFLGNDRDLAALAVASILALPKAGASDRDYAERVCDKLVTAFKLFSDETVRITVLDKLVALSSVATSTKAVSLMNDYLASSVRQSASPTPVQLAVLSALGTVGNGASFSLVYSLWKEQVWQTHVAELEAALVSIAEASTADAVRVLLGADIGETKALFAVLTKNAKKSPNFCAELAENVLSKTINSKADFSGGRELVELQIAALMIIADAQWTRASKLVISYFAVAREEYASGVLDDGQFVDVIRSVARFASPDSAAALSGYLSDLNKNVADGTIPATPVVLAVISSLGELGDKAAFDTLLYVTYLSYPEDVIRAARNALARLKW